MALVGWVDTETLTPEEWADAPDDEAVLTSHLRSAYSQCEAFLPHRRDAETGELVAVLPTAGSDREASCRLAQIMQARALYRSTLVGSGDQVGTDGLTVTVFPMDWTVKNLLRPKRVGRVL